MFSGATNLNMDPKGRISIPSRYRDAVMDACSGKLVVTIDGTNERCLWMYPLGEWQEVERKIDRVSDLDRGALVLKRLLVGHANHCEMSSGGRVLIPRLLIEHANLDKSLRLVGQGKRFEIWNEELWKSRCVEWGEQAARLDLRSEELAKLSL